MTGSIRFYPMTGLMSSTRERTLIKLDVATQRNHSKPQYQGTSSQNLSGRRHVFTGSYALDHVESVSQVECCGVQAEKQDGEDFEPKSEVIRIKARHPDKRQNSGRDVNGKTRQRPGNQSVHGSDWEFLRKSEHPQVESANCPDDHGQANEMQIHHKSPPIFVGSHKVSELARRRLKGVHERAQRSFIRNGVRS